MIFLPILARNHLSASLFSFSCSIKWFFYKDLCFILFLCCHRLIVVFCLMSACYDVFFVILLWRFIYD